MAVRQFNLGRLFLAIALCAVGAWFARLWYTAFAGNTSEYEVLYLILAILFTAGGCAALCHRAAAVTIAALIALVYLASYVDLHNTEQLLAALVLFGVPSLAVFGCVYILLQDDPPQPTATDVQLPQQPRTSNGDDADVSRV